MFDSFMLLAILVLQGLLIFFMRKLHARLANLENASREGEEVWREIQQSIQMLSKQLDPKKIESLLEKALHAPVNKDYTELNPETFRQIISGLTRLNAQNDSVLEEIEKERVARENVVKKLLENLKAVESMIRNQLVQKPDESQPQPEASAGNRDIVPQTEAKKSPQRAETLEHLEPKDRETPLPSPHEGVKNILAPYKTEKSVYEVLEKSTVEQSSQTFLKDMLEVYRIYYNDHRFESLWQPLENELRSNYGVTFRHAKLGFNKSAAIGFDVVRREEIFMLEEFEKVKIDAHKLDHRQKDIILFELCPQVRVENEVIYNGKVVVS